MEIFKKKNGCKHKWTVAVNKEIDSAYEQLVKSGESYDSIMASTWGFNLFRKTGVVIMLCPECGAVDKTIFDTVGRRDYQ